MSDKATAFRVSKLNEWELAAASSLKKLYKEHATLKQKAFGVRYDIGSAGMVSQYLNAKRPLGLIAAIKFAKGLGVTVADISPTLAAQLPKDNEEAPHKALAERLATADTTTVQLVKLALYENDETALNGLSPSLVAMVRGLKAAIAAQGGLK